MNKKQQALAVHLSDPNIQAFLGMLRDAEGTSKGADPYRVYGGNAKNQLENLDARPNFQKWGFTQTDGKKNTSSATGAYQFLQSTWKGLEKEYGFSDFTPQTQDLAAIALLKQNGALSHVLKGDFKTAVAKSNKTWASLPGSPYSQKTRDDKFVANSLQQHLGEGFSGYPTTSQSTQTDQPTDPKPQAETSPLTEAPQKDNQLTKMVWKLLRNLLNLRK